MKERPILFSAPMVRAIIKWRKTQTRRVFKYQGMPNDIVPNDICMDGKGDWIAWFIDGRSRPDGYFQKMTDKYYKAGGGIKCPYGKPGDRLWVRETFNAYGYWLKNENTGDRWKFIDITMQNGLSYYYGATNHFPTKNRTKDAGGIGWYKRPSIFMPRAASRISLKVKNVRVERLQDISEKDAISEGIESFRPVPGDGEPTTRYKDASGKWILCPIQAYRTLWESINGPGSWDQNPWVWVVEF